MKLKEINFEHLPVAHDAERAVVGAILLDNGCIGQAESLSPDHFTHFALRRVYKALLEMWGDGCAADIVTVTELLKTRKQLDEVGGTGFVADLTTGVPPRANIDQYVRILHEKKQLRDIITHANLAISRALDNVKPAEILKDIDAASVKIAADTAVMERDIFLNVRQFTTRYRGDIEWRVNGVIEVGTNGLMIGMPKDGKSPSVRALAVCLASGVDWLDIKLKRCRTALISREDYPGTTSRFIRRFIQGTGIDDSDLHDWLWINSREQKPTLFLDEPADLALLIANLKRRRIEFCILDVLNVMHQAKENDNTEMRKIFDKIDHIRSEVGCQMLVVHHKSKFEGGTIANSARGAGAIGGFAEFIIDVATEDEENEIRRMQFKTKAAGARKGFNWQIVDTENGGVRIERVSAEEVKQDTKKKAKGAK